MSRTRASQMQTWIIPPYVEDKQNNAAIIFFFKYNLAISSEVSALLYGS